VGAFPVKRDTADLSALKQALRRLKAGRVLVVFPEGTRQVKGFADHAYAGIGFLAAKAGVPIIPALIEGTEEAFPRGAKKIKSAAVSVLFGKEIHIEGGSQYQEIAQQILESIKKLGDGSPN
jgi:1-acyl-sn-glycerol-3-phosphate acyltransferase